MLRIIVREEAKQHVGIYPGEENVEWIFNILFNKLGYSVPDCLLKGSGSEETGYEGYIKVELKPSQTFEDFINTLRQELPVIPEIEPTMDGCILYLTKPYLKS